nr:hypothetical protein GCM10020092_013250 [Actinoplanes digitatis]
MTATSTVAGRSPSWAERPLPHRAVHLADARGGGRAVVELGEQLPPVRTELLGQRLVHARHRHRRRGLLKLGQRLPVRRRHRLGHRGLEDRQGLPELHRAALELAQDAEELIGGALLDLGGDDIRGDAGHPLAEP